MKNLKLHFSSHFRESPRKWVSERNGASIQLLCSLSRRFTKSLVRGSSERQAPNERTRTKAFEVYHDRLRQNQGSNTIRLGIHKTNWCLIRANKLSTQKERQVLQPTADALVG